MTRRICVVTGSRAEYGLLRGVMQGIRDAHGLQLQIIATGTHLSADHGLTYQEIERDGFAIDRKVDIQLTSDDARGLTRSMGVCLGAMGEALAELSPALIVILGDRYEMLAVASAALVSKIPIAHIHGGEVTQGAFDDSIRHAITKMSHLHFVAAEPYRERVIQLGEQPDAVLNVGGLGVDSLANLARMEKSELEASLSFEFADKNLLITFHPVTLAHASSGELMQEMLAALSPLNDTRLIFTMPNADTDGQHLAQMIRDFAADHPNAVVFTSMGQTRYLSCMHYVDGVVGNSSSGLLEAPSLNIGTVNIGERQDGRLKAASVIDCATQQVAIGQAIARLYDDDFQSLLGRVRNPYGDGGAARRIVSVLRERVESLQLAKPFYDLHPSAQTSA